MSIFFFQAEDGIRDGHVTGVQTCALPVSAVDVDRLDRPPLLVGPLEQAERGDNAGSVDPDVEAAELLYGELGGGVDRRGLGDVQMRGGDPGPVLPEQLVRGLSGEIGVDVGQQDVGAGFGEARGDGPSQAAGAAGDDGTATAQRDEVTERCAGEIGEGESHGGAPFERGGQRWVCRKSALRRRLASGSLSIQLRWVSTMTASVRAARAWSSSPTRSRLPWPSSTGPAFRIGLSPRPPGRNPRSVRCSSLTRSLRRRMIASGFAPASASQ